MRSTHHTPLGFRVSKTATQVAWDGPADLEAAAQAGRLREPRGTEAVVLHMAVVVNRATPKWRKPWEVARTNTCAPIPGG